MTREELLELIEALREEAREEDDPDSFLEAEIFALLSLAWLDAAEAVDVEELLTGTEDLTAEDIEDVHAGLNAALGTALVAAVAGGLWRLVRAAFADAKQTAVPATSGGGARGDGRAGPPPAPPAGLGDVPSVNIVLRFGLVDERAVGWLHENSLYYVRRFYDDRLAARVREVGEQAIREGLSRDAAGELFARELGPMYGEGLRYWRLHAAAVTVRAREFGRISGYVQAGVDVVFWSSVRDRRTSEQCNYLHGLPMDVADMVATRDAVMAAETPEAQKAASPWLSIEEVKARVEANGGRIPAGILPPVHGHCRVRTVVTKPVPARTDRAAVARLAA